MSLTNSYEFLYLEQYTGNLTMEQFEEVCQNRITVYQNIQKNYMAQTRDLSLEEGTNDKQYAETNVLLSKYQLNQVDKESSNNDNLSHFLCRLVYCNTDDNRRYYVNMEKKILRARVHALCKTSPTLEKTYYQKFLDLLSNHSQQNPQESTALSSFKLHELSQEQFESQYEQISCGANQSDKQHSNYFKIPFFHAHLLIQKMVCYIEGGIAYVHYQYLYEIIDHMFETILKEELQKMELNISQVFQDQRIHGIVHTLQSGELVQFNYKIVSGKINLKELPAFAKTNFPPCMKYMYENLQKHKHLKHYGRLQLGLFLQGTGLSMNDALVFWEKAFSAKTSAANFQQEYAYNIRHGYGREGQQADYNPHGCEQIIQQNLPQSNDEYHGCPFKLFDRKNLESHLRSWGSKDPQIIDKIIRLAEGQQHQAACILHFDELHPVDPSINNPFIIKVGLHPNQYFEASVEYHQIHGKQQAEEAEKSTKMEIIN